MAVYEKAIEKTFGFLSELVDDDDLRAKLDVEKQRLELELDKELLKVTTTPKVDAFVKLLIATRDIIIPMLRPVGSACMTAFGMYMHYKGTPMDTGLQIMFDGAFPAWGASRHVDKTNKEKTLRSKQRAPLDDEDFED